MLAELHAPQYQFSRAGGYGLKKELLFLFSTTKTNLNFFPPQNRFSLKEITSDKNIFYNFS